MSTCILIQPHNLMHELLNMSGDDGIVDRFLIISARPVCKKQNEGGFKVYQTFQHAKL